MLIALILFAMPFVLVSLSPHFGAMRGLWAALAGVLLGMLFERPFRPYNITQPRWVGREHWTEVALVAGLLLGMLFTVAEALVNGAPLTAFLERIWVPVHRVVLFAGGLTMLRQAYWQRVRLARGRGRVEVDEMPAPVVKPALPRAGNAPGKGDRQ